MKNGGLTILAAVGASLCCTGPLFFTAIGATSLAGFTVLEPLRPFLSLLATGLIGAAFWRSYRPATAAACCSIEEKTKLSRQRVSLWLTSAVVAVLLAFPYISDSSGFAAGGIPQRSATSSIQVSTWKIEGMTCAGCASGLEAALSREAGMVYCAVRYDDAEMDCRVDGEKMKAAEVPAVLTQYGYAARQVDTSGST